MKFIKFTLKGIGFLLIFLILSILTILGVDAYQTSFLNLEKNTPDTYLITNVNLLPMTEDTVLENKMVYIKNGVIQAIEDTIAVENVPVIDGKNQYLTPGLTDMHIHLWDRYELGLYLANGVTTVRNVWGMPMHLRIKKAVNQDKILSPLFFTSGPKLTGPEFIGDDNLQLFTPEAARQKVIDYKTRGYDFIKSYYGLPQDIFDAIIEQAAISDMDIVAHASQKVPYPYHFNPQIITIEHAEDIVQLPLNYRLDTAKLHEVIEGFTQSPHTSFSPTLMAYYNIYRMIQEDDLLTAEQVKYMNPSIQKIDSKGQFERWQTAKNQDDSLHFKIKAQHDFHLYIIKKLHEAGVNLVCGTDAGIGVTTPGFSIHEELAFYQKAGLSNYEVLKTATINPSKTHRQLNNLGTLEMEKIANLLLVEKNPLEDLSTLKQPKLVFVKGKKIEKEQLDTFKNKAKDRSNFLVSVIRYVENLIVEKT